MYCCLFLPDTSMEKLYASGEGSLFLQSLEWLSSDKESLKTLGTLAVGNFARRGTVCCVVCTSENQPCLCSLHCDTSCWWSSVLSVFILWWDQLNIYTHIYSPFFFFICKLFPTAIHFCFIFISPILFSLSVFLFLDLGALFMLFFLNMWVTYLWLYFCFLVSVLAPVFIDTECV